MCIRHQVVRQHSEGLVRENKQTQRHENELSLFLCFLLSVTKTPTHFEVAFGGYLSACCPVSKWICLFFAKWPPPQEIKTKCDIHLKAIAQAVWSELISMGPLYISALYPPGLVTSESVNIISLSLSPLFPDCFHTHETRPAGDCKNKLQV